MLPILLKKCRTVMLLILSLFLAAYASAGTGYKTINTAELKTMMDGKASFALVDARTKEEYDEAHIPGAINVPEKDFEKSLPILPADRSSLLVIYCNGVKCGKSKKVAAKATKSGFTNIILYGEGFPVWEEHNMKIVAGPGYGKKIETDMLHPAALESLIRGNRNAYVLVDVRDENEFREGHIPTAINIPAETFALKSDILPKEKKIIVYCNTGGRSYLAYRKLIKLAYAHIHQALFAEWKDAHMPIEK